MAPQRTPPRQDQLVILGHSGLSITADIYGRQSGDQMRKRLANTSYGTGTEG